MDKKKEETKKSKKVKCTITSDDMLHHVEWDIKIEGGLSSGKGIIRKGKGSVEDLMDEILNIRDNKEFSEEREILEMEQDITDILGAKSIQIRIPDLLDREIGNQWKRSEIIRFAVSKYLEHPDMMPPKKYNKTKKVHISLPRGLIFKIKQLKVPISETILRSLEIWFKK